MAKKNLASLMSGIMGETPGTENTVAASSIKPSNKEELNQTKRSPGRPKLVIAKGKEEVRATFIVSEELLKKMKYIALAEDVLLKEVLNSSLSQYIAEWESKNGRIKLPNM